MLHDIGQPLHVTTARRLPEAVDAGQGNIAVMLGAEPVLDGLEDWSIWWGANLGAAGEELVHGRVGDVAADIARARGRARDAAGWVMDVYLLRRTT